MPTFAELLAARAGKSVPQIEESLAQKAEQAEAARMAKQARDYEFSKAQEQASSMPKAPPSIDEIVAQGSMQGNPEAAAVSLGPDALSPSADISAEDFNKFNAGKLTDAYALSNNKGKVAAAGLAGLGATALMYGGGQPPSPDAPTKDIQGPSPAAEKSEEQYEETPEEKQEKSSFKRIMSMLGPSSRQVTDLSKVGGTTLGGDDALKAAMAERDRNRNYNDFVKGAQLMGSGMSGTDYMKTGGAQLEEQGKLVDQPVKDLKERVENQENDPKSTASVAMRGMALKMGFKFGDNVSAADIKKQIPQMTSLQNHADTVDAMRANKAMAMLSHQDSVKQKVSDKDQALMFKLNDKMNSPEMGSSRAALGKAALIASQADRINALIMSEPNPDNLTGRQAFEVAKALDSMLASGASTISGTEHLMPKTMMAEIAKGGEYLQNKPIGAKLGKFIKQMQHLVEREKAVSQKQIADSKEKLIAGLPADFRHRNQADIENLISVHAKAAMSPSEAPQAGVSTSGNEVARKTSDGRTAIFDATTKQFIRWQ